MNSGKVGWIASFLWFFSLFFFFFFLAFFKRVMVFRGKNKQPSTVKAQTCSPFIEHLVIPQVLGLGEW